MRQTLHLPKEKPFMLTFKEEKKIFNEKKENMWEHILKSCAISLSMQKRSFFFFTLIMIRLWNKKKRPRIYCYVWERNNQPILYCTIKEYKIQNILIVKKHVTIIFEAINLFDKIRRKESKSMYGWVFSKALYITKKKSWVVKLTKDKRKIDKNIYY